MSANHLFLKSEPETLVSGNTQSVTNKYLMIHVVDTPIIISRLAILRLIATILCHLTGGSVPPAHVRCASSTDIG